MDWIFLFERFIFFATYCMTFLYELINLVGQKLLKSIIRLSK